MTEYGHVMQYNDGKAWGVASDGSTVYCGKESDVKAAIANPKLKCGDPTIDGIIALERQLIEKAELEAINAENKKAVKNGK